jgi:predicted membrane protein
MKKGNVFWGLLFILAAILIILNQLGFFAGISIFEIVATVILAGIVIMSVLHLNFWGIMFPLALICTIYADQWNITEFTPWPALLTALLLSIGLSIMFKRPNWWGWKSHQHNSFGRNVINEKDDTVVECTTSFGECIKYVNSDNFMKANINCSFGEVKVYFDNASIPSGRAEINLSVSFGEAILFIPKTWNVINEAHVFLGDIDRSGNHIGESSPVVTIRGSVSFGDAKIIYV